MEWINIPADISKYVGFVYEITELDTGKKYIGLTRFFKDVVYKPLKGKKNKRHNKRESDWRNYNSSNKEIQEKIATNPTNYKKEIVRCCESITELRAYECYLQLQYYFNGDWNKIYNEMVNLRLRILKK